VVYYHVLVDAPAWTGQKSDRPLVVARFRRNQTLIILGGSFFFTLASIPATFMRLGDARR
jgi:hypothetical protein